LSQSGTAISWANQGQQSVGPIRDSNLLGQSGTATCWANQGQQSVGPIRDSNLLSQSENKTQYCAVPINPRQSNIHTARRLRLTQVALCHTQPWSTSKRCGAGASAGPSRSWWRWCRSTPGRWSTSSAPPACPWCAAPAAVETTTWSAAPPTPRTSPCW